MKLEYYKYLFHYGLPEIFSPIQELSYSQKLELVKYVNDLNPIIANKVLYDYQEKYIYKNRIQIPKIKKVLKEMVNKYEKINQNLFRI